MESTLFYPMFFERVDLENNKLIILIDNIEAITHWAQDDVQFSLAILGSPGPSNQPSSPGSLNIK